MLSKNVTANLLVNPDAVLSTASNHGALASAKFPLKGAHFIGGG